MIDRILREVSSIKYMFILFGVNILLLAAATFIERSYGAAEALAKIYHNPIVITLWMLLIINVVAVAHRRRWFARKALGVITLHAAFIVILIGAAITHFWSYEGVIHIREAESSDTITMSSGEQRQLPFSIELVDFVVEYYAGSASPSSYSSEVKIDGVTRLISVNKPLYIGGYRVYQTSYDRDEQGSIFTANYDMVGMYITYFGYALILLGILILMLRRGSHFRALLSELNSHKGVCSIVLLLLISSNAVSAHSNQTIPTAHAELIGRLFVQERSGRIEPINTYVEKIMRKVHRSRSFQGLSAEQVVWGYIFNPNYWNEIELISQKNSRIAEEFNLSRPYVSMYDLFDDDGRYILSEAVVEASKMDVAKRGTFEKDLLKLDERISIIYALQRGEMLSLFPLKGSADKKWYSMGEDLSRFNGDDSLFVSKVMPWYTQSLLEASSTGDWEECNEIIKMIGTYQLKRSDAELPTPTQLTAEIFYNQANPLLYAMIGYLICSLLLFVLTITNSSRFLMGAVGLTLLATFSLHCIGIAVRWYISGHLPWASAYESMVHVACAAAVMGLILRKRSTLSASLALLFAGIVLFISSLNWLDPEITPMIPVLKSTWLMVHVSTITSAYALMGIVALMGVVATALLNSDKYRPQIYELRIVAEITLHLALYLLTIGIFVGAVWANESWGRYWGWDSKETWALITMLIYVALIHLRFTKKYRSDYLFFFLSFISFASVLMTYFGVNFYLTGLHSYAAGEMPQSIYIVYIVYILYIIFALYTKMKLK